MNRPTFMSFVNHPPTGGWCGGRGLYDFSFPCGGFGMCHGSAQRGFGVCHNSAFFVHGKGVTCVPTLFSAGKGKTLFGTSFSC
jgi:hypothetical protein